MTKDTIWFRHRTENLREPCPICHKNLVELGSPYCFKCAKKKGLFGD